MNTNEIIKNRYDFMMIFDVKNGNPNGDPRLDNKPRQHRDNEYGYVTSECLKRKIRDYVAKCSRYIDDYKENYDIFISADDYKTTLNDKIAKAKKIVKDIENLKDEFEIKKKSTEYMCNRYYDVRTFGAVMNTGDEENNDSKNKGKAKGCYNITGPVQITYADSVDVIDIETISITRKAITNEADREKLENGYGTIGTKYQIPYALYTAEGHISVDEARISNFTEKDLKLLWDAIMNMFEVNHSNSHGEMCMRELIIFKHDTPMGRVSSHKLFDKIHISKKDNISTPTKFDDYNITVDTDMPNSVECIRIN